MQNKKGTIWLWILGLGGTAIAGKLGYDWYVKQNAPTGKVLPPTNQPIPQLNPQPQGLPSPPQVIPAGVEGGLSNTFPGGRDQPIVEPTGATIGEIINAAANAAGEVINPNDPAFSPAPVKITSSAKYRVNTERDPLNLRTGPGTGYGNVVSNGYKVVLQRNSIVDYLNSTQNGFMKVQDSFGNIGWASAQYLVPA